MKEEYTIDYLIKTFEQHTICAEENAKQMREDYIKNYPESELPDHMKEGAFNLSEALMVICKKIKQLGINERKKNTRNRFITK